MKRAIALTLVLLVLALGGFAAVTVWMCRTQEQVEFINLVSLGDASEARGLHMTERNLLGGRVLWTTVHDLGTETRVTKTRFAGQDTPCWMGGPDFESAGYSLNRLLPDTPELDAYLQQNGRWEGGDLVIRPADYAETYDLCLSNNWGNDAMLTKWNAASVSKYRDFPYLHIPVGADDEVTVYFNNTAANPHYNVSGVYGMEGDFTSMAVTVPQGTVVTAGFGDNMQPEASWAPEGFGLWLVSGGTRDDPEERLELVYPLDIERQRVEKLTTSPDGEKLLLFLTENGQVTLQVLSSSDFTLLQSLPLEGTVEEQWQEQQYDENGNEIVVSLESWDTVQVNKGDGFYAVAVGRQLTVLQSSERGLEKVFSCKMPILYSYLKEDGVGYTWDREEAGEAMLPVWFTPADTDMGFSFETMSMVLRDGRLAMVWNTWQLEGRSMVQIYSGKGLEYARCIGCGLYSQKGGSGQQLGSMKPPELFWAE